MGITDQGLEFLLSARRQGVDFSRTMTIGRQYLLVPPPHLHTMLPAAGVSADVSTEDGFADELFRRLGAEEVCSLDGSDFEGATHVHDLNTPLPRSLAERFSLVVDGGCLEHVFDVASALRSCMEMVAVGGHLVCMCPVNNAAGHGFYQFSPELYFRVLSPENGFTVERMLLAEVHRRATWYEVVDPAAISQRIEFTTRRQAYLYVQARRVDGRPPLLVPPVQSDYADQWRQAATDDGPVTGARPERVAGALGRTIAAGKGVARRHAAIYVPVRRARRLIARARRVRWRRYSPAHFRPLGRHLA